MGFLENITPPTGNNAKADLVSISGVSASQMNIHNYSEITVHFSTGGTSALQIHQSMKITLKQEGCYHNGQPMWTFHDGYYDGDWDRPYISHTGHHHNIHEGNRFGSALCEGASHKLRYGGEDGQGGNWEFLSHGYITSWTTASTLNFFQIQGSGNSSTDPGHGWVSALTPAGAAVDNYPYGRLRVANTNSDDVRTYNAGGLTAVTVNGINPS